MITRKFVLHWDAALLIAAALLVSFGFNLYQRQQYRTVMEEGFAAQVKAQDMEVNWKYAKSQLDACRKPAAPES